MRMKGISHFATGLCVATFVPGVVEAAAQGSLLIALGGAAAMLPDFLDFRFARFWAHRDADIQPDSAQDAQRIADEFAANIALARTGTPRTVQFHPRRLGAARWLTYTMRFDARACSVIVTMGEQQASADVGAFEYGYGGELEAGELGGPSLRLFCVSDGITVHADFLPWHRTWSHSLLLALACGVAAYCVWGGLAGVVTVLGFSAHVLEDQLGHMGSNLFWPITSKRGRGLGLLHSGDAIPNMLTVWLSLTILLVNLDRAQSVPMLAIAPFVLLAIAVPTVLLIMRYVLKRSEP
jgi:membrane-bound metal-dependent hydrolase YbcI (DUF457 family)